MSSSVSLRDIKNEDLQEVWFESPTTKSSINAISIKKKQIFFVLYLFVVLTLILFTYSLRSQFVTEMIEFSKKKTLSNTHKINVEAHVKIFNKVFSADMILFRKETGNEYNVKADILVTLTKIKDQSFKIIKDPDEIIFQNYSCYSFEFLPSSTVSNRCVVYRQNIYEDMDFEAEFTIKLPINQEFSGVLILYYISQNYLYVNRIIFCIVGFGVLFYSSLTLKQIFSQYFLYFYMILVLILGVISFKSTYSPLQKDYIFKITFEVFCLMLTAAFVMINIEAKSMTRIKTITVGWAINKSLPILIAGILFLLDSYFEYFHYFYGTGYNWILKSTFVISKSAVMAICILFLAIIFIYYSNDNKTEQFFMFGITFLTVISCVLFETVLSPAENEICGLHFISDSTIAIATLFIGFFTFMCMPASKDNDKDALIVNRYHMQKQDSSSYDPGELLSSDDFQ